MADAGFKVNGKEYAVPTDFTLGEMCEAEELFGVEFGSQQKSGVRMAAALLYIALRRAGETVTSDDIKALPADVFKTEGDAVPPTEGPSGSPEPSGPDSRNGSDHQVNDQATTGPRASLTGSTSAPVT